MKSFVITHKNTGIKLRYISEKRFKRHKRNNFVVSVKNLRIEYSLEYAFKGDKKYNRCYSLYGDIDQDFPLMMSLLSEYQGEIVFKHNETLADYWFKKHSNNKGNILKRNIIKRTLDVSFRFRRNIESNCYFVFKNSSDYNQFKLSL